MRTIKIKKYKVTLEVYGYVNEEGGLTMMANMPSKRLSTEEITESNEEMMEKSKDIFLRQRNSGKEQQKF